VATEVRDDPTHGVRVEDVDLSFVPVPKALVAVVELDGRTVLIDGATGLVHVLDPIGSVVWRCLDGVVGLGVLADELAAGFGADPEVVRGDLLDLTRSLARLGLLEGIARPVFTPHPDGVEVGEQLEPFRLPTLDGGTLDLAELGEGSVLLVNWSPHCGYCARIAGDLAELREPLERRGTRLVLVTAGEAAANRELLDEHALDAPVLLRSGAGDGFADPFPGMGTPVAYLLDPAGRVVEPLAFGASAVPALARRAAGLAEPAAARRTDVRYLPGAIEEVCGPGASGKKPRVWTENATFRIGEYHVGIRADAPASAELIGRALSAHRAEADPAVPPNYSVVLGEPVAGPSKELRLLRWQNTTVVRSRSTDRVLRALAAHLSSILSSPEGLLRTTNVAVARDDEAVLLPPSIMGDLDKLQPRLAREGWRPVDEPYAVVDPATDELVVPEPGVHLDGALLAELGESPLGRSELPRVLPGRYRLRAWAMWRIGEDPAWAELVSTALMTVSAEPERLAELIVDVEALLRRVPPMLLDPAASDRVAERLRELGPGSESRRPGA
jgi:hypothetical protein